MIDDYKEMVETIIDLSEEAMGDVDDCNLDNEIDTVGLVGIYKEHVEPLQRLRDAIDKILDRPELRQAVAAYEFSKKSELTLGTVADLVRTTRAGVHYHIHQGNLNPAGKRRNNQKVRRPEYWFKKKDVLKLYGGIK